MSEKKPKQVLMQGAISPEFIGNSIANTQPNSTIKLKTDACKVCAERVGIGRNSVPTWSGLRPHSAAIRAYILTNFTTAVASSARIGVESYCIGITIHLFHSIRD